MADVYVLSTDTEFTRRRFFKVNMLTANIYWQSIETTDYTFLTTMDVIFGGSALLTIAYRDSQILATRTDKDGN